MAAAAALPSHADAAAAPEADTPVLSVNNLTFGYDKDAPVLRDINIKMHRGDRLLLVGDNGAGKTTLLRLLAGKHMHAAGAVQILGRDSFFDTMLDNHRSYMGSDWGRRTVAFAGYGCALQADVKVSEMMLPLQRSFTERREMLIDLLGVNLEWRMHQVSDGQRRRVQLFLQLLRPVEVLLLDEITTDLDVITRADFLEFLKREAEDHGTTIVYATHIFDGLAEWFTHVAYIEDGTVARQMHRDECTDFQERLKAGDTAPLLRTIETWLRADKDRKRAARLAAAAAAGKALPLGSDEADSGGKDRTSMAAGQGNGFSAGRMAAYISMTE
ncbi:hypothetical protein FNF27_03012 [Cafeteria roenbergensis]|uniref:ABC transporter domain-containing protein n=1 Tax=Cafeteria roenbergensis TaxID=33653 RepID=A0A5A8CP93_CAFRO|nr:hypothetical protein FNF29_02057 [Cafeteria roenbergensis]KAA0175599.1 hypothetical protein FNF27_03012 [Cafeteria roenbergensis]|eukprot:KAA0154916.1 hypothetical protein FNF29_02057 [Cafeteria roenbergensis]